MCTDVHLLCMCKWHLQFFLYWNRMIISYLLRVGEKTRWQLGCCLDELVPSCVDLTDWVCPQCTEVSVICSLITLPPSSCCPQPEQAWVTRTWAAVQITPISARQLWCMDLTLAWMVVYWRPFCYTFRWTTVNSHQQSFALRHERSRCTGFKHLVHVLCSWCIPDPLHLI